ncbi:MAG TPA: RES family NAD+ phosphorylase [Candidatus Obscuribacterales bacterium]
MLTDNQLIAALASMPILSTQGEVCRVIHIRYANTALSSIGSLKTGGRYNQKSAFQALYLADNPVTALLEVEALLKTRTELTYVPKPPLIVLSIYYQLNAILDLTHLNNQRSLATNLQELTGNWLLMNAQSQLAPTQILGEAAYSLQSIEALKVPSARDSNN